MEKDLSLRLNSIQNQILDLYEQNSTRLDDHITLWNLMRKEYALLFYARKQGLTRLGGQILPSSASSQSSAKEAIKQALYLQSLRDSQYGDEPWTLQETSKERLNAEPEQCFKKGGTQIDVMFDKDPENVSRYVLWTWIYHQDDNDAWVKTRGRVDHKGLYYLDEQGDRVSYIDFSEEAMKYSNTALWTVMHNSIVLPDDSSTSEEAHAGTSDTSEVREPPTSADEWLKELEEAQDPEIQGSRRRGRPHSTPRQPKRLREEKGGGGGGGGGRGRLRFSGRLRRGGRGGRGRPSRSLFNERAVPRPPSAAEVGRSTKTVEGPSRSRLEGLLKEARDPPFVGLKGKSNTLKCVRYRLKGHYGQYFDKITTTWQWTSSTGNDRCGDGRILILFKDDAQRSRFLDQVKLPKSVKIFIGSAVGI